MEAFLQGDFGPRPMDPGLTLLALLVAFLCGQTIAWIYMWTHSGLSYSRSFVNSLIVMAVIVSVVMMVLSNNLVTAFGLMAVFAIVRFRNILRDTLDTAYVLVVIVIGMACGTLKFPVAILGTIAISLILLYLRWTSFGSLQRYDVILNLHWTRPMARIGEVDEILGLYALRRTPGGQRVREEDAGADLSWRLLMRDPASLPAMVAELQQLPGVSRVTGLPSEGDSEI